MEVEVIRSRRKTLSAQIREGRVTVKQKTACGA